MGRRIAYQPRGVLGVVEGIGCRDGAGNDAAPAAWFAWLCLIAVAAFLLPAAPAHTTWYEISEQRYAVDTLLDEASAAKDADDRAALLSRALETALAIEDEADRNGALSAVGVAHVEFGDVDGARAIAAKIGKTESRSGILLAITRYHIAGHELETARRTAHGIELPKFRDTALDIVGMAWAADGHFDTAIELAERIEDQTARMKSFAAIAIMQAKAGDREAAQRTFDKALDIAHGFEADWMKSEKLYHLGIAQSEAGLFDASHRTMTEASDLKKPFVVTSDEIIIRYEQDVSEDDQSMLFTYDPLTNTATLVESGNAEDGGGAVTFSGTVGSEIARGNFETALKTARLPAAAAIRDRLLGDIAEAQAKSGAIDAAMATLAEIADSQPEHLTTALMAIAFAQMKAEDLAAAHRTASRIPEPASYAMTMATLAGLQAHRGDSHAARATFALAREALDRIPSHDRGLVTGMVEDQFRQAFPEE